MLQSLSQETSAPSWLHTGLRPLLWGCFGKVYLISSLSLRPPSSLTCCPGFLLFCYLPSLLEASALSLESGLGYLQFGRGGPLLGAIDILDFQIVLQAGRVTSRGFGESLSGKRHRYWQFEVSCLINVIQQEGGIWMGHQQHLLWSQVHMWPIESLPL